MVKAPRSFRLPDRSLEQISEIAKATGENKTEVVARAVDDLFRRELVTDQQAARLGFAVRGLVDASRDVLPLLQADTAQTLLDAVERVESLVVVGGGPSRQ